MNSKCLLQNDHSTRTFIIYSPYLISHYCVVRNYEYFINKIFFDKYVFS
jgi:hypothetical protein